MRSRPLTSRYLPVMSQTRLQGPSDDEWKFHRETLTQWYWNEKKPLHQVSSLMAEKYGFIAKKNQYERYLHGKWKLTKNTKSSTWKAIAPIVHNLERRGCRFELWIDQDKKSIGTIRKETRRYIRHNSNVLSTAVSTQLPRGVVIRTISSPAQSPSIADLPFFSLEQYLGANLPIMKANQNLELTTSLWSSEAILSSQSLTEIPALLQVAVLDRNETDMSLDLPRLGFELQPSLSPLHRCILFGLANNFAGLHALSGDSIDKFLRETRETFLGLTRWTNQQHALSAILRSYFRHSIQHGHSKVVDFLLSQSILGLEPDYSFETISRGKRTAIEVAAAAGHTDLVKVLLKHGANPNLTFSAASSTNAGGALNCFISDRFYPRSSPGHADENNDHELFRALFNSEADMQVSCFRKLIRTDLKGHLISAVLWRDIAVKHREWASEEIFHEIFIYQGNEVLQQTLATMRKFGTDLNQKITTFLEVRTCDTSVSYQHDRGPDTFIDIVAARGNLKTLESLLEYGAQLVESTLFFAIEGRDQHLVQFVLNRSPIVDCELVDWDKALSLAIYSNCKQMLESIALRCLESTKCFNLSMEAAAVVGDWVWFQRLYTISLSATKELSPFDPDKPALENCVLENALAYSIRDEQISITQTLLENGTNCSQIHDIEIGGRSQWPSRLDRPFDWMSQHSSEYRRPRTQRLECPLNEALKKRNAVLVELLLNAGAMTTTASRDIRSYGNVNGRMLALAVEWGDIQVLESILEAGVTSSNMSGARALIIAVQRNDRKMLDMIIYAGISINSYPDSNEDVSEVTRIQTALHAAVRSENMSMIQYVLQLGADPHDPNALRSAFYRSNEILDLLLQRHATVYPKGQKGWGGDILMDCIDGCDLISFQKMVRAGADPNEMMRSDRLYDTQTETDLDPDQSLILDERMTSWNEDEYMSCFGYAIVKTASTGTEFVEHLLENRLTTGCTPDSFVAEKRLGLSNIGRLRRDTALLKAVKTSDVPTIKLLIKHGASVNFPARMNVKRTPLQQATEEGRLDVVQLLLEYGADVNGPAACRGGATALQLAAIQGYIQISLVLLKHGADVHAPASIVHGRTALEGASEHGRLDTVALLLQHSGQDIVKHEKELARAMAYAKRKGFDYIADLIEQYRTAATFTFDEFLNLEPSLET